MRQFIFIHGVGNETVKYLSKLKQKLSVVNGVDWRYVLYDDITDELKTSWWMKVISKAIIAAVGFAASSVGTPLAGAATSIATNKVQDYIQERVVDVVGFAMNKKIQDRIVKRVTDEMDKAVNNGVTDIVLVGHSLGSLIAIETLRRKENGKYPVSAIITTASPHGIRFNNYKIVRRIASAFIRRFLGKIEKMQLNSSLPLQKINVYSNLDPISGSYGKSPGWLNIRKRLLHPSVGKYVKAAYSKLK